MACLGRVDMQQLVELVKKDAIPMEVLHRRYGALLELVRKLIGVVPNCDPYLEIWPMGFRSYNVMVPNLLNLPPLVWGMGAPKRTIGLAIYAASRAAGCAYCSAHTCSFALRRGTSAEQVARALELDDASHGPKDRAALAVALALARVPSTLGGQEREELSRQFTPAHCEWIVLSVAMMGFLNKFMDAMGIPLETSTVDEVNGVIAKSGWTPGKHLAGPINAGETPQADSLATKLSLIRYAPKAVALDRKWTRGVPHRWPAVGEYLRARTGYDFPLFSRLRHRRAIRAIATMVRDNLDAPSSAIGIPTKLAAAAIYAEAVGGLGDIVRGLRTPRMDGPAMVLARAISPSPAAVDAAAIDAAQALKSAEIIELVTWISVLQLLHRLSVFYA
jgi:hypothetical protein